MLKVILARHSETPWNEQLRYIGRTDLDLSAIGNRHADLLADFLKNRPLDAVFANMYLHHAPDPAGAIQELARVLRTGGALCLTDLDAHDHTWQREQMADLWLGFERDDIRRWFAEAGLKDIDVDCAEGTCNACGPDGTVKPLSIFVAIGRKGD